MEREFHNKSLYFLNDYEDELEERLQIADYIHVCPFSHQNISACIIESITFLKPHLKKGLPELGVPPLEPLSLDILRIGDESSITTNLTNINVWSASNFEIVKLNASVSKNTRKFIFKVFIPNLAIEGDYSINTVLSIIQLKGSGPFYANITDVQFQCVLKGKRVSEGDTDYVKFEKMKCIAEFGKPFIHFENLFNGDPIVGTGINAAIQDNIELLFNEIKPQIIETLSNKFTDIANTITMSFKYEEVFP
ncbi:hypothetical protein FQA39_LY08802 [Lamprigera yunnana]|nr:hypothetical protein FQA39_LY08802 [Lamprigera yunnana]